MIGLKSLPESADDNKEMKQFLLPVAFWLVCSSPGFGQAPPPNDNFSNRIVLSGNSVAFSGTLAGATLEAKEALGGNFTNYMLYPVDESVWWTWTAPQTSLVTVEMIGASADSAGQTFADGIVIYDTTNVFTRAQPVAEVALDLTIVCDALTFSAIGGSNYQFQLLGSSSTAYQFLLMVTNNPLILQAPRNLTVSSNESTLLTVVAEGYRPLSYQWQLAGTNLAGQTAPMLALTNIDGSQAGSYTVVVTNIGGATTSAPAVLAVSSFNVPPALTAMPGQFGQFDFGMTGEVGRNYRIEASVDLVDWTNEYSFPRHVYSSSRFNGDYDNPELTSVVFNTNGSSSFSLGNAVPWMFIRASQYQPANEICINNLRQIRFAKSLWQRDSASPRWYTPEGVKDLAPYFLQGSLPYCPLDTNSSWVTSYSTGVNNCASTCDCMIVPGTHILEEPQ
ncbi:MAG TPA: hypothetical protein VMR33_08935 [Candidatus Baltobacteraceae bacterium]|jgi:hypothetical protein|nr:hypothetical protein [Candidatus Baltobacteraceae bacterium]